MGSYAHCWLGEFHVGSTKDCVDPGLIGLFRRTDKHIVDDPSTGVLPQLQFWLKDVEEDPSFPIVYFEAPVSIVRDRRFEIHDGE